MHSLLSLIGLALLDSLSIGTLVIPLALILVWRSVHVPALIAYLFTVAAVYFRPRSCHAPWVHRP